MKRKKLLLLQPPWRFLRQLRFACSRIDWPISRRRCANAPGVEVKIIDFHAAAGKRTVALPRELRYLADYYAEVDESPFSAFHRYSRYGSDPEDIAKKVAAEKPDWVGISAMFTPYWRQVIDCAEAIKRLWPMPVIAGGFHATAAPEHLLQSRVIDAVVRGEGERPLVDWLRAELAGKAWSEVPNLVWRRDGQLVYNPEQANYLIDDLPMPDFSDLARDRYAVDGRPLCFVLSSRGCPYRCAFCAVHCVFGDATGRAPSNRWLPRSISATRRAIGCSISRTTI
jgi:radical SAM superfamily enzyme YgiQ (UPF0313 family)